MAENTSKIKADRHLNLQCILCMHHMYVIYRLNDLKYINIMPQSWPLCDSRKTAHIMLNTFKLAPLGGARER